MTTSSTKFVSVNNTSAVDTLNACAEEKNPQANKIMLTDFSVTEVEKVNGKQKKITRPVVIFPSGESGKAVEGCFYEMTKNTPEKAVEIFSKKPFYADLAHYLNQMQGKTNELIFETDFRTYDFASKAFDIKDHEEVDGTYFVTMTANKGNIDHLISAETELYHFETNFGTDEKKALAEKGVDYLNYINFLRPYALRNHIENVAITNGTQQVSTLQVTDTLLHLNAINDRNNRKSIPTDFAKFLTQGGLTPDSTVDVADLETVRKEINKAAQDKQNEAQDGWIEKAVKYFYSDEPKLQDMNQADFKIVSDAISNLQTQYSDQNSTSVHFEIKYPTIQIPVDAVIEKRLSPNDNTDYAVFITVTDPTNGMTHSFASNLNDDKLKTFAKQIQDKDIQPSITGASCGLKPEHIKAADMMVTRLFLEHLNQ